MGLKYYPFQTENIEVLKVKPIVVIAITRQVSDLPEITLVGVNEIKISDFKEYGKFLAKFLYNNMASGVWEYFIKECNKFDKEEYHDR